MLPLGERGASRFTSAAETLAERLGDPQRFGWLMFSRFSFPAMGEHDRAIAPASGPWPWPPLVVHRSSQCPNNLSVAYYAAGGTIVGRWTSRAERGVAHREAAL